MNTCINKPYMILIVMHIKIASVLFITENAHFYSQKVVLWGHISHGLTRQS